MGDPSRRVFAFVREEAVARGEDVTPGHWLLALLRDVEDPIDFDRYPHRTPRAGHAWPPNHGPSPIRLLIEAQGLTLDQLRTAVLEKLGREPRSG